MPESPIIRLTRAYQFAAAKHVHQRRKGALAEPYVNHLTEVAGLVAQALDGADVDVVIAAVLHDTVEDTETSPEELASAFGPVVAGLVAEVTDDKALPKAVRKSLQIEHAPHASRGAQIIKLADKTSNIRALRLSPPDGWSDERRTEYIDWASAVVAACRPASPWLAAEFDAAVAELRAEMSAQALLP